MGSKAGLRRLSCRHDRPALHRDSEGPAPCRAADAARLARRPRRDRPPTPTVSRCCTSVSQLPVEAAANPALIAFLAEALRLRKSDIAIVAGESARVKRLDIAGDPAVLGERVSAWIAGAKDKGWGLGPPPLRGHRP